MRFPCPNCHEILDVADDPSRSSFSCPHCGAALDIWAGKANMSSAAITLARPESLQESREALPIEQGITPQAIAAVVLPRGEVVPPLRVFGRFPVRPYQAEGGWSAAGIVYLMLLELGSALVLGALASLAARLFYLILLFPLAIGLGTGMAGVLGVRRGKVRNLAATAAIGVLGGCIAMFSMYYCDYLFLRRQLPEELGSPGGFFHYIDATAKLGVNVNFSPFRSSDSGGINLGYEGTYYYYLFEVFIVAGLSLFVVTAAARKPYCGHCNNWKKLYYLGHLDNPPGHAAAAVREGELQALQPSTGRSSLVRLLVHVCPQCRTVATIDVLVQYVTRNDKNQERVENLAHISYPPEALAAFQQLFPKVDFAK